EGLGAALRARDAAAAIPWPPLLAAADLGVARLLGETGTYDDAEARAADVYIAAARGAASLQQERRACRDAGADDPDRPGRVDDGQRLVAVVVEVGDLALAAEAGALGEHVEVAGEEGEGEGVGQAQVAERERVEVLAVDLVDLDELGRV